MAIEQVIDAAFAPFYEQVGWQGLAYGLLGVKTLRKTMHEVKQMRSGDTKNESAEKQQ